MKIMGYNYKNQEENNHNNKKRLTKENKQHLHYPYTFFRRKTSKKNPVQNTTFKICILVPLVYII